MMTGGDYLLLEAAGSRSAASNPARLAVAQLCPRSRHRQNAAVIARRTMRSWHLSTSPPYRLPAPPLVS